ncbi:MAG TPA: hypothetical protein VLC50_02750 [Actinomycetes bacterium]|nr:hypothetical protein [Actinomycetes bacterium]
MDASHVAMLRELLAGSGWIDRTREFARSLRRSARPGGLLLVGTPSEEPWHLAAHLSDESRLAGRPELEPTLVRWDPPAGAPAHLAVGLSRLEAAARGETLFVVAPDQAPASLLERISDARGVGATILALDAGDPELEGLAHDTLTVPGIGPTVRTGSGLHVPASYAETARRPAEAVEDVPAEALVSMATVQHLVSTAAGEPDRPGRRGLRERLSRFLDAVSGPSPDGGGPPHW